MNLVYRKISLSNLHSIFFCVRLDTAFHSLGVKINDVSLTAESWALLPLTVFAWLTRVFGRSGNGNDGWVARSKNEKSEFYHRNSKKFGKFVLSFQKKVRRRLLNVKTGATKISFNLARHASTKNVYPSGWDEKCNNYQYFHHLWWIFRESTEHQLIIHNSLSKVIVELVSCSTCNKVMCLNFMTYYEWLVFFWPPSTLFIFIFETLNSIHMTGCDRDGTGRPIL